MKYAYIPLWTAAAFAMLGVVICHSPHIVYFGILALVLAAAALCVDDLDRRLSRTAPEPKGPADDDKFAAPVQPGWMRESDGPWRRS